MKREAAISVKLRSMDAVLFVALAAMLAWTLPALPAETDDGARILIAQPQLQDEVFGSTILFVKSMPDGSSLGFILNKPTPVTLGQLFPGDDPSRKVVEPVFLGGPIETDMIVALVKRHDSPGEGSIRLAPDLFLVVNRETVDRIIESDSGHARFYAGVVVWRPGELDAELERGFWFEMEPDVQLVFSKNTDGLWQELVNRSEMAKHGI